MSNPSALASNIGRAVVAIGPGNFIRFIKSDSCSTFLPAAPIAIFSLPRSLRSSARGLLTVALGLLAFELAGADAGVVLGTALAIKMVAYVGIAFIVGAFANQLPRRAFLVAMDLVRAAVALLLPFITGVWQIYVLDLPAAIGLGGVYADLPSHHSGRPAEREGIRPSALTLAPGL